MGIETPASFGVLWLNELGTPVTEETVPWVDLVGGMGGDVTPKPTPSRGTASGSQSAHSG